MKTLERIHEETHNGDLIRGELWVEQGGEMPVYSFTVRRTYANGLVQDVFQCETWRGMETAAELMLMTMRMLKGSMVGYME